jgi:hypothetical protein
VFDTLDADEVGVEGGGKIPEIAVVGRTDVSARVEVRVVGRLGLETIVNSVVNTTIVEDPYTRGTV